MKDYNWDQVRQQALERMMTAVEKYEEAKRELKIIRAGYRDSGNYDSTRLADVSASTDPRFKEAVTDIHVNRNEANMYANLLTALGQ